MPVTAYVGLPGAGKTYNVVGNVIIPALKKNRVVCTNIPLKHGPLRERVPKGTVVELPLEAVLQEPDTIEEYAEPGCVLVIDECWRIWPAGQKTDKVPQAFKSLLAEHRHRVNRKGDSMQVVLVTQDLSQIAAFARAMVDATFHHTQLSHVGQNKKFRVDIYRGAVTGTHPPEGRRYRQMFGRYKKEVYKCYKSHTLSESDNEGANEANVDTRANALKDGRFLFGGVVAVGLLALGIWAFSTLAGKYAADEIPLDEPAATSDAPASPVLSDVPRSNSRVLSLDNETVRSLLGGTDSPRNNNSGRSAMPPYEIRGYLETAQGRRGVIQVGRGGEVMSMPVGACEALGTPHAACLVGEHYVTLYTVYPASER